MNLIKHSQRTNRKPCGRCGETQVWWAHDLDKSGYKRCNNGSAECIAAGLTNRPVNWTLINADGTPHAHTCYGTAATTTSVGRVEVEPIQEKDRYAAMPTTAATGTSGDAAIIDNLRILLGATVSPEQVRAVVDEAMSARTIDIAEDLTERVTVALAELESSREPLRVEILDKVKGETRELAGTVHQVFPTVVKCAQAGLNVWLVGPAGTGKSTIARQVAETLDIPFGFISLTVTTPVSELVGYRDAGGTYQDTIFRRVFEHGGVFLFDECDNGNANTLGKVNEALANGHMAFPDGVVTKHADCRIIAAANTYGTGADRNYVGRMQLDAAFMNRFGAKIQVPIDEALEMAAALAQGAGDQATRGWVAKVRELRVLAEDHKLKVLITPRESINGAILLAAGFAESEVLRLTILNGMSAEDARKLGY